MANVAPDVAELLDERVLFAIERLFEEGDSFSEARAELIKKFGVARSTAEEDIKRARKRMTIEFEADLPHLKSGVVATLLRTIAKAEKAKDFTAVAALVGRLAKITGIESAKKIAVDHGGSVGLTSAGTRARIGELLDKAARAAAGKAEKVAAPVDPLSDTIAEE